MDSSQIFTYEYMVGSVVNLPIRRGIVAQIPIHHRGCHLPSSEPNRELSEIHRVSLKVEERLSWLQFKYFDRGTVPLIGISKMLAEQGKRSIELDHPFVRVICDFSVRAYNKACEMHVKKGEHNNLHDFEFMECKYLKLKRAYYFYLTIEAIEEGDLGVYEAKVVCDSDDGRITLSKFVLTDRAPVGKKATAISHFSRLYKAVEGKKPVAISQLSRLISIYETMKGLKKDIKVHLKTTQKSMKGKAKETVAAELKYLKKHNKKALIGLRQVLSRDTLSLFPPVCTRTTNRDDWCEPNKNSGMVARINGATSTGYDFYNPLKAFGPSLIW